MDQTIPVCKPIPIFSTAFAKISSYQIISEVREKGYFAFEGALNEAFVDQLLEEINFNQILMNTNDTGVVTSYDTKFLTHCLANSEKAYNLITSQNVLELCNVYFQEKFKLTNHRIYQTTRMQYMPWHTDNNKQKDKRLSSKHGMPGLLYLFYLSDVTKNPFQFVENSHKYSHQYDSENYLSNKLINNSYAKDIVTFKMKKGSLILCDTHGIHRAEPYRDKNYKRTTLLFQVDEVGNSNEGHGEKNLVNTEYLKNLTPELMDYLGFGFNRTYPAFPVTSISTLPINDIFRLQKQLVSKTVFSVFKNIVKTLLPGEVMVKAKRMQWKIKSSKN